MKPVATTRHLVVFFVAAGILLLAYGLARHQRAHHDAKLATAPSAEDAAIEDISLPPAAEVAAEEELPAPGAAPKAPTAKAVPAAKAPLAAAASTGGCFTVTYHHRPTAGHNSREKCSEHANLIQLALNKDAARLNARSVCVRLDGTPVHYERVRDNLVVGPLAGPGSVIQVHYCLGRTRCADPCVIPKDAFLSSIGAGAPGSDENDVKLPAAMAKWDPQDPDEDRDVTAELDTEFQEQVTGSHGLSLFKDWQATAPTQGCGQAIARAGK